MSQLYPDLINNFPNDIDPNRKFQDVTSANKALVLQYYTYKEAGNDAAATDLLNTNPALKDTIVTAEMIQYIYDMNVSQQRFYLNDVQTYLVNLVKPKGYFSETTKYTKYDTVQYTVNGAIQSYMGAKVDIPIGTPPTNTTYFDPITLRGEKGASGTGLSVRGVWNSLDTYYVNDCVSLNNAMWYAIVENTNNAPNDLSTYWKKFADLPSPIRVSTTQPASQNVGDEWHQISDTDNSLAIKVKQADGSYVAKNVVSNASFITDANGNTVQGHIDNAAAHISTALHTRTGTVNNLAIPNGAKNLTFLATADIVEGDKWVVNGLTQNQSGSSLTFDQLLGNNLIALKVSGQTVQSGSGNPSPDNVRAMSGIGTLTVNGTDYAFPQTLYSLSDGTADEYEVVSGQGTKRIARILINDSFQFAVHSGAKQKNTFAFRVNSPLPFGGSEQLMSDTFSFVQKDTVFNNDLECISISATATTYLVIRILKSRLAGWQDSWTDAQKVSAFKTWFSANPVTVLYPLLTSQTISGTTTLPETISNVSAGGAVLSAKYLSGGTSVTAQLQNGEPLPGGLFKSGCWVTGVRLSDDGTQLFFRAGASTVPSIFGNGSDGDAVISGTVTLPVPVPHQSIVEKQYKSLTINAGAILKCAAHNAGLIIRVQGDCIIHGTIDQSGLAPKTNPQNNYPYPSQLVCGDGGDGGDSYNPRGSGTIIKGGRGMLKRAYGGGWSAGGAGGTASYSSTNGSQWSGGRGGDVTNITILDTSVFAGGSGYVASSGHSGVNGGGGQGGNFFYLSTAGGTGGTGAGGNGQKGTSAGGGSAGSGSGGGAGNYGGGVILIYVGGNVIIDGSIKCNGLNGGNGADALSSDLNYGGGAAGGGAGGGAIYIVYKGTYTNTGILQVNGGLKGNEGYWNGDNGVKATSGGIGSITAIQYTN